MYGLRLLIKQPTMIYLFLIKLLLLLLWRFGGFCDFRYPMSHFQTLYYLSETNVRGCIWPCCFTSKPMAMIFFFWFAVATSKISHPFFCNWRQIQYTRKSEKPISWTHEDKKLVSLESNTFHCVQIRNVSGCVCLSVQVSESIGLFFAFKWSSN